MLLFLPKLAATKNEDISTQPKLAATRAKISLLTLIVVNDASRFDSRMLQKILYNMYKDDKNSRSKSREVKHLLITSSTTRGARALSVSDDAMTVVVMWKGMKKAWSNMNVFSEK